MDFLACLSRNVHFLHIRLSIMWYLCSRKVYWEVRCPQRTNGVSK